MPRYIDADTLYQKIDAWRKKLALTYGENDDYVEALGDVLDIIEDAPKLKMVAGVRCENCRWYSKGEGICFHPSSIQLRVREDFYCGYGKKIGKEQK